MKRYWFFCFFLVSLVYFLPRPQPAYAQQFGGAHMFAVTAPGTQSGTNILFVIDPATTRLLIYEHNAISGLKLNAVRNIQHELKFDQFPGNKSSQTPSVSDCRKAADELEKKRNKNRKP